MIAWVDLETTGLDERTGHLLEVAVVITDDKLKEVADFSYLVLPIGVEPNEMKMDPVVLEMHTKNRLISDVIAHGTRRYLAEQALIENVRTVLGTESMIKETPLAGSTVGFDRRWLRHHMPTFEGLFSYRSIDVSSITELAKRMAPAIYEGRPKNPYPAHRAITDVLESIGYLRYYIKTGFIGGSSVR